MDNYKQQVTEFFNRRTAYDQEGLRHPREARLLLESVPLQTGQRILDIATGTGLVAIPAAKKVGSEGYVIGVDFSSGMLHQAKQKIEAAALQNIELIEADADFINFKDNDFDVIFCCSAITYLRDIPTTLQRWYRFLIQEGFVAFTCPAETAYMASIQVKVCANLFGFSLPHINEPLGTPEKCHHLLGQAGFREIQVKTEPSGEYLSLSDRRISWNGSGFYPRGNPLLQLSPEQLVQLQAEYRAEIEKLATDHGIWHDTTTLFVRAQK
jgi:arsenite methyltransferase